MQTGSVEDVVKDPSSRLAKDLVPPPNVDNEVILDGEPASVVDIAFTSSPGVPTGSKVMDLVASLGGDIVAGTFETVGTTQVGRLALGVKPRNWTAFFGNWKIITSIRRCAHEYYRYYLTGCDHDAHVCGCFQQMVFQSGDY